MTTCTRRPRIHTQLNNGQATAEFDCGVEATIRSIDFASCGQIQLDEPTVRRRMAKVGKKATIPQDWKRAIEHPDTAREFAAIGLRPPKARLLDGVPVAIAEAELEAGKLVSAAEWYQPVNVVRPALSGSRTFNDNHATSFLGKLLAAQGKKWTTKYDSLYDGRTRVVAGMTITYPKGPQRFPWTLAKRMFGEVRIRTRNAQGQITSERKLGDGLFLGISVARAKPLATPTPAPVPQPVPETPEQKIARLEADVKALTTSLDLASSATDAAEQQRGAAITGLTNAREALAGIRDAAEDAMGAVDAAIADAGGGT